MNLLKSLTDSKSLKYILLFFALSVFAAENKINAQDHGENIKKHAAELCACTENAVRKAPEAQQQYLDEKAAMMFSGEEFYAEFEWEEKSEADESYEAMFGKKDPDKTHFFGNDFLPLFRDYMACLMHYEDLGRRELSKIIDYAQEHIFANNPDDCKYFVFLNNLSR